MKKRIKNTEQLDLDAQDVSLDIEMVILKKWRERIGNWFENYKYCIFRARYVPVKDEFIVVYEYKLYKVKISWFLRCPSHIIVYRSDIEGDDIRLYSWEEVKRELEDIILMHKEQQC